MKMIGDLKESIQVTLDDLVTFEILLSIRSSNYNIEFGSPNNLAACPTFEN